MLKGLAEKRRVHNELVWELRAEQRLPSADELHALVTPELACAYYSMRVAEQRLKVSYCFPRSD